MIRLSGYVYETEKVAEKDRRHPIKYGMFNRLYENGKIPQKLIFIIETYDVYPDTSQGLLHINSYLVKISEV